MLFGSQIWTDLLTNTPGDKRLLISVEIPPLVPYPPLNNCNSNAPALPAPPVGSGYYYTLEANAWTAAEGGALTCPDGSVGGSFSEVAGASGIELSIAYTGHCYPALIGGSASGEMIWSYDLPSNYADITAIYMALAGSQTNSSGFPCGYTPTYAADSPLSWPGPGLPNPGSSWANTAYELLWQTGDSALSSSIEVSISMDMRQTADVTGSASLAISALLYIVMSAPPVWSSAPPPPPPPPGNPTPANPNPASQFVLTTFTPSDVSGTPANAHNLLGEGAVGLLPSGPSQSVDELQGTSSIGTMEILVADPANTISGQLAAFNYIGQPAAVKIGFGPAWTPQGAALAGCAYADFVTAHVMSLLTYDWNEDGQLRLVLQDVVRSLISRVFLQGGPYAWAPGEETPPQPAGPTWATNGLPISSQNPYWLQGNPLDLFLAVLQNFVGLGQNPQTAQQCWLVWDGGDDATLIGSPESALVNPWVDVAGILALRDAGFAGDWVEFKITDPQEWKSWAEEQLLKPLGLFMLVLPNGQLSLKSMKPAPGYTSVTL